MLWAAACSGSSCLKITYLDQVRSNQLRERVHIITSYTLKKTIIV
jgi:hypothetical protein